MRRRSRDIPVGEGFLPRTATCAAYDVDHDIKNPFFMTVDSGMVGLYVLRVCVGLAWPGGRKLERFGSKSGVASGPRMRFDPFAHATS